MLHVKCVFAILSIAVTALPAAVAQNTAPANGKTQFARYCAGCHSLDDNKEGPHLRGVYGRKSASLPGFNYSPALRKLNLQWNDSTLDRWLANPDSMAPDTDMAFHLSAAEERKAIVAYLKTLSAR